MKTTKYITKKIVIEYSREKEGIFCSNGTTLQLIWGSRTSPTDIVNWYGAKRHNGGFLIPHDIFEKRIRVLKERHKRITEILEIVDQIKNDEAK